MFKHLLVPVDGSDVSKKSLKKVKNEMLGKTGTSE